jgi:hypothetical protein
MSLNDDETTSEYSYLSLATNSNLKIILQLVFPLAFDDLSLGRE